MHRVEADCEEESRECPLGQYKRHCIAGTPLGTDRWVFGWLIALRHMSELGASDGTRTKIQERASTQPWQRDAPVVKVGHTQTCRTDEATLTCGQSGKHLLEIVISRRSVAPGHFSKMRATNARMKKRTLRTE